MLLGRLAERAALGQLLDAARGGRSGVLVVHGEAGVGKTALLEDVIASAAGMRMARVAGIESEMELAYAGLQLLCAPVLDELDRLPDPQRAALGVVFGLQTGEAPDRFLVGLAVLSLLADAASKEPLLCVIDDAQWLDRASAQAVGFVARRLFAEQIALVIATREPGGEFGGLPELAVEGLSDGEARELLASVIRRPLDERIQERFLAEAGGNPLALLELPPGLAPAERAGASGVRAAPGLLRRLEDSFGQRLGGLPAATQRLLLVAAAEPTGDPVLVWRAAGRLGIGMEAAAPAEAAGLLAIGARVTFRHPLVRSAAYRSASAGERRAAHRALAEATDPRAGPDRRAWHRAQAAAELDEEVAAELERSASRAQARGGFAAAAAFLERSAALTPGPARRADRALAAAQATSQAGAFDAALGLLAAAEAGPLDELQRAQAALLHGQIALASFRGRDAETLLLTAARLFEPLDARLARETYLDALSAGLFVGRLTPASDRRNAGQTARAGPPPPRPARAPDLLLDGLASLATDGYPAGTPMLKRAVSAFRADEVSREEGLRWRRPGGGQPLPPSHRLSRPHVRARGARPRPVGLRRVATPPAAHPGGPGPAAPRLYAVHRRRHGGVRRADPGRAARDRRAGAQTHHRDIRRPDRARGADRPPGQPGSHQPADRRAAVHQPRHRRLPPREGLRQTRHQLPQPAHPRAARPARPGASGLARAARGQ
jgi:hypothetical protein